MAAALDWGRRFASTREALKRLDPDAAAGAVERLREALAAHRTEDGIWFGSRAWIVIAGTGDDEGDHGWATALLTSRETGGAARKYSDAGPANAH